MQLCRGGTTRARFFARNCRLRRALRRGADPARVAVLACLHLADQVRQLQREQDRLLDRLEALDRRLSSITRNPDSDG